jgi:hypothetical protein
MLAKGTYANGTGIVAMTSMRLLFLKHGVMSQTVEDFPYAKISSVQWHGGLVMGTLAVYTSGNRADIKNVPKDQGKAMADKLRAYIAQGAQLSQPPTQSAQPAPTQDVASRLAALDQLRTSGAITEAEYQQQRAAIISSL